jgi:5-formyltetrahydrofolate cyclo-ligase
MVYLICIKGCGTRNASFLRYRVQIYYLAREERNKTAGRSRIFSVAAGKSERLVCMESATESKAELRKKLLVTRRAMTKERWLSDSERIQARALSLLPVHEAARIHCYVSMEHDREARTLELLETLALDGKAVYMPYIERGVMRAAVYHPGQQFRISPSAPATPEPLVLSEEERFEVVFVPLAGFDRSGGRIGFGKGWYDRFFSHLLESGVHTVKIGLAFSFQEVSSVPCDPWDERLDMVVTENEIINCQHHSR